MSSIASTVGWASCNLDGWHTSHRTILTLRARREAEQRAVANLCAEFGREAPQRFVWFVQPWACRKCLELCQEVVFFPMDHFGRVFSFQKKTPGFFHENSHQLRCLTSTNMASCFRGMSRIVLKSEMAACFRLCSECLGTTFLMLTLGLESTEMAFVPFMERCCAKIWSDFI